VQTFAGIGRRLSSPPIFLHLGVDAESALLVFKRLGDDSSTGQRRPIPSYPQANMPFSGPMNSAPRCLRSATLATVAGCSHILPFIAGAISSGASVARTMEVKASSAKPCASLAQDIRRGRRNQYEIGTIGSSICPGCQLIFSSKMLVVTG